TAAHPKPPPSDGQSSTARANRSGSPKSTSGPSRGTIIENRAEVGVAVPAQVKLPGAEPNLLARKWNWLRDLPARSALRACNHPRVRNLLGQRHASALASHETRLPSLSASDRQIVDTVDREGVFMTTLDAL